MIDLVGDLDHVGPGIHAEDECATLVPFVQMGAEAKVGIAAKLDLIKGGADQVQALVYPARLI